MKLSIIVPVYKEKDLETLLYNLLKVSEQYNCEIVVAMTEEDHDSYTKIINSMNNPNIKGVLSQRGRGIQLQKGVENSEGDLIIFLHADNDLKNVQIKDILDNFNIYDYGAFSLRIKNSRYIFRIIEFFVNLRSRFLKLPYGDQTIFIKKEKLLSIGGVKNIPLFEDVELMLRAKKHRLKFYLSPFSSETSDRRWQKKGVFVTTIQNLYLLTLFLFGTDPYKLYKIYYNHK